MARGHPDLPKPAAKVTLKKQDVFASLHSIDNDPVARQRVLAMEIGFRHRMAGHIASLPAANAPFRKFKTSPFVLMLYSMQNGYSYVSQIENDIIPAKVFSSMETSAGKMVEDVVLPIYSWQSVPSAMQSVDSVLDGRRIHNTGRLEVATLKSGPSCLNDSMAKDIGSDVFNNVLAWSATHNSTTVDFTYGVLYGTKKQSNKKDWHILRNIAGLVPQGSVLSSHKRAWDMSYSASNQVTVTATIRVGLEWWSYLGGPNAWLEVCVALIRACIVVSTFPENPQPNYLIKDLASIVSFNLPNTYNVALLQRSQYEWLMFLARHFCDELK